MDLLQRCEHSWIQLLLPRSYLSGWRTWWNSPTLVGIFRLLVLPVYLMLLHNIQLLNSRYQLWIHLVTSHKSQPLSFHVWQVICLSNLSPPPLSWSHLCNIPLADPDFGRPGRIDLLLGVDHSIASLLHGRRTGLPGSPNAFETRFGWVLASSVESQGHPQQVATHHASLITGDDLLRKFWEIEESPGNDILSSAEEQAAVLHFKENHRRTESGRFIVPLPRKSNPPSVGESRSQAVRRFLSLEHSLHSKNEFSAFDEVMQEYFDLCHAELVPAADLEKPEDKVMQGWPKWNLTWYAYKTASNSAKTARMALETHQNTPQVHMYLYIGPKGPYVP